jgi:hypothetical protein
MGDFTAYFDASGDPSTDAISVVGLVASAGNWVRFDQDWEECLNAFGAKSLHMKEFCHSTGQYAGWDQDEQKRRRFIWGLHKIIEKHVAFTAQSAISMSDYNRADETYQLSEFGRPYCICAVSCGGHIREWIHSQGQNENSLVTVFEHGDADQKGLESFWRQHYPDQYLGPIIKQKQDTYPDPDKLMRIRPFEAADYVAYEAFRISKQVFKTQGGNVPFRELRKLDNECQIFQEPNIGALSKRDNS